MEPVVHKKNAKTFRSFNSQHQPFSTKFHTSGTINTGIDKLQILFVKMPFLLKILDFTPTKLALLCCFNLYTVQIDDVRGIVT